MDWKKFESVFVAESTKAMEAWLDHNPNQTIYAMALHESYRELEGQIVLPQLATNSLQELEQQGFSREDSWAFNPADWKSKDILPRSSALQELEGAVIEAANASTPAQWYRTEKQFLETMTRVAKALSKVFKKYPQFADDFIVFFNDEADEDGSLLKKSVSKDLFEKFFPQLVAREKAEASLAASDDDDRLQRLLLNPFEYDDAEKMILAYGARAIEGLLRLLRESPDGWFAASLLGDLGIRDHNIIEALRHEFIKRSVGAAALTTLGDQEFLFDQTDNPDRRETAIAGILTGLFHKDECSAPVPLDYRPLERLLDKNCSECTKIATEAVASGGRFLDIQPADIDEAIRGIHSDQPAIRMHAVCVLGNRALAKVSSKRILPEVVRMFADPHPGVRRLALLSLANWNAAAKAYRSHMEALQQDENCEVRSTATYVLYEKLR